MSRDLHASNDFREQFLLRSDVIFLNHGSFGACPRPVFEDYQRWQLELERQPVEFLGRRFTNLLHDARQSLATFVGADSDEVVFVPNVTVGLNTVARALPLSPGDQVLSTDQEYGAMDRTWRFICQRRGASYVKRTVRLPIASTEQVVDEIWSGVTDHTRILFLSHITSLTALILPIDILIRRARDAGITTVIDGAHAPGQLSLDLHALEPDFYVGNCHKWLCAPKGSAFLFARRPVQHLLEPLIVSWGWQAEQPGPSRFIDEQEWQGTQDIAAYLSVPSAIAFQAAHHWDRVQRDCHELARGALADIGKLTGLPPIRPDSPRWYAQMASAALPACDAQALEQRLFREFSIEVRIATCQEREFVRVSVQAYNTASDIVALGSALRRVL